MFDCGMEERCVAQPWTVLIQAFIVSAILKSWKWEISLRFFAAMGRMFGYWIGGREEEAM